MSIVAMDINQSAELTPSPSQSSSRQRPRDVSYSDHIITHADDDHDNNLPPITTDSLPTARKSQIAYQSWERVSARQPIGSPEAEDKPNVDEFIDFAATILETRLADVVRHRIEAKGASLRSSHTSATSANDNGQILTGGKDDISPAQAHENHCSLGGEGKESVATAENSSSKPSVLLSSACRSQLRAYVRRIAFMYHENRYHGLEHAVHVTMSANKLLDMLHEGILESSDDDEADIINDFSVSEPHIRKPVAVYKPASNSRRLLKQSTSETSDVDDLDLSLRSLSENGHPPFSSRGALDNMSLESSSRQAPVAPSTATHKNSLSEDFKEGLRPKRHHQPRSSTYHIHSDMYTKFAFVFAAIIHDVDHQGVPNTRLVLENDPVVETHGSISTAEKHSIKVAFRTLNEGDFDELRSVVFESPDDRLHLHRIVTNLVISTDIASPDRMQSTKIRWEEAFAHPPIPPRSSEGRKSSGGLQSMPFRRLSVEQQSPLSEIATVQASKPQLVSMQNNASSMVVGDPRQQRRNSLKRVLQLNGGVGLQQAAAAGECFTTECCDRDVDGYDEDEARTALRHGVVIETMLNVADVAHSMQSWELFLFWNGKLFEELYVAYKEGRSDGDPSEGWYENQLGFYRLYVIPLAEKMKTCGVFGEEGGRVWVRNAKSIRDRWSREGEEVTRDMIASVKRDL